MGCGSVWFLLDELARTRCGSVAATFGLFSTTSRGRAAAWLRQHLVLARRLRADVVRLGCGNVWFFARRFRADARGFGCGSVWLCSRTSRRRAAARLGQSRVLRDEFARIRCGSVAAAAGSPRRISADARRGNVLFFSANSRGRAAAWLRQHLVLLTTSRGRDGVRLSHRLAFPASSRGRAAAQLWQRLFLLDDLRGLFGSAAAASAYLRWLRADALGLGCGSVRFISAILDGRAADRLLRRATFLAGFADTRRGSAVAASAPSV